MSRIKARFKVGQHCYCKHPYAFRGEAPFIIVAIAKLPSTTNRGQTWGYIVQYADGILDSIPVLNEGGYKMECRR